MGFWPARSHAAATAAGGRRSKQGKTSAESGRRWRLGRRPQPGSPGSAGRLAVPECVDGRQRMRRPRRRCGGGRGHAGRGDDADRAVDGLCGFAGTFAAGGAARRVGHRADVRCRGDGKQACLVAGADLPDPELGEQRQQGQASTQARCAEASATRRHWPAIVERAVAPALSAVNGWLPAMLDPTHLRAATCPPRPVPPAAQAPSRCCPPCPGRALRRWSGGWPGPGPAASRRSRAPPGAGCCARP